MYLYKTSDYTPIHPAVSKHDVKHTLLVAMSDKIFRRLKTQDG